MIPILVIFVRVALFSMLGLFVLFLVAIVGPVLIRFVRKRDVETPKLDATARFSTLIAAAIGASIAILNFISPIGKSATEDPGELAIRAYFRAVIAGDFEDAVALIHPKRIDEINRLRERRGIKTPFDGTVLKESYTTSQKHWNFNYQLVEDDPAQRRKLYRVSFDVEDEIPRNIFSESKKKLLKDFFESFPKGEGYEKQILDEIRRYLDIPEAKVPEITEYIRTRQAESLLDPLFISEVRREKGLTYKPNLPSMVPVDRHFVLLLTLLEDKGQWKISDGLSKPETIAVYGTTVPK